MKQNCTSHNNNKDVIKAGKTAIVIITTLLVCGFMTIPAKNNSTFNSSLNATMTFCIATGALFGVINYKKNDKTIFFATAVFFIVRIMSYILNRVPIIYGGSLMIQAFFLIGVCSWIYGNKSSKYNTLISFAIFDVCAVFLCYYNLLFRTDYVEDVFWENIDKGINLQTSMFQNPNTAGMVNAAAVILCLALLANSNHKKRVIFLIIPIIAINLYMLFLHTGCRSAQTGLVATIILAITIKLISKLDSIRMVLCVLLITCFVSLIPVYTLVYWNDNELFLRDNTIVEQRVDDLTSGRYAIWKVAIMSQDNHILFGLGGHNNSVKKRKEFVKNFDTEKTSEYYIEAAEHGSLHNGYLTMMVEAGVVGTSLLLAILLRRIWMIKGRFRDGNWHYLLLVYVFWVNLFEAKLINSVFFTGLIMMVLLMPNEEEDENECKVIPETTKKEIKEAV